MTWFGRRAKPEDGDGPQLRRWAALVRHEMVQLTGLIAATIIAFFLTRTVAAGNRDNALRDADTWYRHGRAAMTAGRLDEATDAFRRAAARRRGERTYGLALASALASRGDAAAARQQLLVLRESAPEDPVINLELARLAASRDDAAEAQRFYYNALYAPWAPERTDDRRGVRMELIRLLVRHGEQRRALSELLAVSAEVPPDARHQSEIAELFAAAGDERRALTHFEQALARAPDDAAALAGAGLAAFHLGNYALARKYLHRSNGAGGPVAETRTIVDFVLDQDPLAPRLGAAERRRRIDAALTRARTRLAMCTTTTPDTTADDRATLQTALDRFQPRLRQRGAIDQDTAEDALELTSRIERSAGSRCAPPALEDRALLLIGLRHGAGAQ